VSVCHFVLTSPPCPLQYDLTGDCHVNYDDLRALFGESEWNLWLYQLEPGECDGVEHCPDINGDLTIDFEDFALLAQEWGL
jgi:hypothetical protein